MQQFIPFPLTTFSLEKTAMITHHKTEVIYFKANSYSRGGNGHKTAITLGADSSEVRAQSIKDFSRTLARLYLIFHSLSRG